MLRDPDFERPAWRSTVILQQRLPICFIYSKKVTALGINFCRLQNLAIFVLSFILKVSVLVSKICTAVGLAVQLLYMYAAVVWGIDNPSKHVCIYTFLEFLSLLDFCWCEQDFIISSFLGICFWGEGRYYVWIFKQVNFWWKRFCIVPWSPGCRLQANSVGFRRTGSQKLCKEMSQSWHSDLIKFLTSKSLAN